MRKEVEALEDHPDLRPLLGNRSIAVLDEEAVLLAVADQPAADLDPAGVDRLEPVCVACVDGGLRHHVLFGLAVDDALAVEADVAAVELLHRSSSVGGGRF